MDIIHLRDLRFNTHVGVLASERKVKKEVVINLQLFCDIRKAGTSDKLEDTVDYKTIEDKVAELLADNEFCLIEKIASMLADICLNTAGVKKVRLTVEKAGTLDYAQSAIVEIERP